jgi:hypothetical protein
VRDALRPLSPEALKAHVVDLLAQQPNIPSSHHGALVAVVNLDYIQIAVATKLNDTWSVQLTGTQAWTGDRTIEGQIRGTW